MAGCYDEFVACCDVVLEMNLNTHGLAHNELHMCMSSLIHGALGKGVRCKLPRCVECAVRSQFPDLKECCAGFKGNNNSEGSENEFEISSSDDASCARIINQLNHVFVAGIICTLWAFDLCAQTMRNMEPFDSMTIVTE
jgi:hypothetical protein